MKAVDPWGIPKFLKVKNRRPLTAKQQAWVDEWLSKHHQEQSAPFNKPKGMSLEEWTDMTTKNNEAKAAVKAEKAGTTAVKTKKTDRPSREGLVSVAELAKKEGMTPREARIILRGVKYKKPACGWAFTKDEVAKVTAVLKAGLPEKKGKVADGGAKKGAAKTTLPGPKETVWSGKAKVTRTKTPAPKPTKKPAAPKVKKSAVTKVAAGVKGDVKPKGVNIKDLHKVDHPVAKANQESWDQVIGA